MEVTNIFSTAHCDISQTENMHMIKNWPGRKELQFIRTLTK